MPKKIKKPRRWPPDMKLATTGYVMRLFDRLMSKKDRIAKFNARGRPVFDYRKPAKLSGMLQRIEEDVANMADSALGKYESKDCVVYVVCVDHNLCVAESLKDGAHLWSGTAENPNIMLKQIYTMFPKTKITSFKPKKNIDEMNEEELREALKRKELLRIEKVEPSLPSADVTPEEIAAASDPNIIKIEKEQEEQKLVTA